MKNVNGVQIEMTQQEIDDFDATRISAPEELIDLQEAKYQKIKKEADRRIELLYPWWTQNNITRQRIVILQKVITDPAYILTQEEIDDVSAYDAMDIFINDITSKSNQLESDVLALTDRDAVIDFDEKDDLKWA